MMFRLSHIPTRTICLSLLVALLTTSALPLPAVAQDPAAASDGYPVNLDLRRKRREIESTLRGLKDDLGDKEKLFNDFFLTYDLPRFTTEEERADLPQLRLELKEKFQLAARNTNIREHLSNLVLKFMYKVAGDKNLHPAARVNAVLVIGDLDNPKTGRGGTDPWMTTMPQLLNIAGAAGAPDGMRVAAIVGIRRRSAMLDQLDDNARQRAVLAIGKPMLTLAMQKETPVERSAEGHIWMRRMAMETLGDLKTAAIYNQLFAIASDQQEPIEVRSAAIETIAKMPLAEKADFDSRLIAAAVADVVIRATETELNADPESPLGYSPRRLAARVSGPLDGIQAMLNLGTADQRTTVDKIEQYVAAIQENAKRNNNDEHHQRRRLETLILRLKAELEARGLSTPASAAPGAPETPVVPETPDTPFEG